MYGTFRKDTVKMTVWCMTCEEISDIRVREIKPILMCPHCEGLAEPYERWDGGREMGCAMERAFGDGNDVGG